MPLATVQDLEARWRPLDRRESVQAEALLEDAEAMLFTTLDRRGVSVNYGDEYYMHNLKRIECAVVMRAMSSSDGDHEEAWGGEVITRVSKDLYLTAQDMDGLGAGGTVLRGWDAYGTRARL